MKKYSYEVNIKSYYYHVHITKHDHLPEKLWGLSESNNSQPCVWPQSHNVLYFNGRILIGQLLISSRELGTKLWAHMSGL